MLQFGVLGPVVVRRSENLVNLRTAMLHRLVSVLLCSSMRPMSPELLIEAMWGDAPPATAKNTLQIYIHRLRRTLGDDRRVVRNPTGYTLTVLDGELDSHNFSDLANRAADAAKANDLSHASVHYRAALALWRGAPFADVVNCDFVTQHSRRLEEFYLQVVEQFAEIELRLGRPSQTIEVLKSVAAEYPYMEGLQRRLILALFRSGRRIDALAEYRRFRHQMVTDLGIEPSQELQMLNQQILRS